jgi:predicted DCC family thiol-disulfide oxidoreductase YuxK
MTNLAQQHPVILFDGVCNFCNSSVQFVIKRDPKQQFRFASLQSEFGQQVLAQHQLPQNDFNSFILLQEGNIYTKSTAALKVAKQLSGLWPMLYGFIIIPPFIRNAVYSFIAQNRYRWFGKREACMLPSPQQRNLFLG